MVLLAAAAYGTEGTPEPNGPAALPEPIIPATKEPPRQNPEDVLFLDLTTVVEGASKYQQKVSEAPASVTIITADDIRRYGWRNLGDVINSVRGFHSLNLYRYTQPRVHGLDGNVHILTLIDGIRINDPLYEISYWDNTFPVDLDLIKKIEIIRGPGSSMYGSNAFLAVVNIITKGGEDVGGGEVAGALGSHDAYQGRATWGRKLTQDVEVLVSGDQLRDAGPDLHLDGYTTASSNHGWIRLNEESCYNVFSKVRWRELVFEAFSMNHQRSLPYINPSSIFSDPDNRYITRYSGFSLAHRYAFSDDLSMEERISYRKADHKTHSIFNFAPPGDPFYPVDMHLFSLSRRWDGEWRFTWHADERHKLIWGTEMHYSPALGEEAGMPASYLDYTVSDTNWGAYLQDEITLTDKLRVNLGLRYDKLKTADTTNPRLALIYNLRENTALKLLYGTAFRAPTTSELSFNDNNVTQKAPAGLAPEMVTTYEVALEHGFNQNYKGIVSGYYTKIEDTITYHIDPRDNLYVMYNANQPITSRGVETELIADWHNGWRGNISLAYIDARDDAKRHQTDTPYYLAKCNLIIPVIPDRLFAGLENQFNGRTRTPEGGYNKDYFLTNLNLTYTDPRIKGLEIAAGAYNLFDVNYTSPVYFTQEGLTYGFKLTYRF